MLSLKYSIGRDVKMKGKDENNDRFNISNVSSISSSAVKLLGVAVVCLHQFNRRTRRSSIRIHCDNTQTAVILKLKTIK